MSASLRDRVLSRLMIDPSGCLIWTGATTAAGYGVVSAGGHLEYVHRLMYEWFVDLIPDGRPLDHLCRIRRCASPADLESVTHRENCVRGISPTAANAAKECCDSGHEFDLINTYYRPDGAGRQCRACRAERKKAYRCPAPN